MELLFFCLCAAGFPADIFYGHQLSTGENLNKVFISKDFGWTTASFFQHVVVLIWRAPTWANVSGMWRRRVSVPEVFWKRPCQYGRDVCPTCRNSRPTCRYAGAPGPVRQDDRQARRDRPLRGD